jgi:hypothetical protein
LAADLAFRPRSIKIRQHAAARASDNGGLFADSLASNADGTWTERSGEFAPLRYLPERLIAARM